MADQEVPSDPNDIDYSQEESSKHYGLGISEGAKEHGPERSVRFRRLIGLVAGILIALIIYFVMPNNLGAWPRLTAAIAAVMAIWWMTEALPIPVTALLPIVVFPVLVPAEESGGGIEVDDVGANYGSNIVFLFMGGFLLALAMQRWNLHRRIALLVLRGMGSNTSTLIGGFMIATGFLSMWVSNNATAVMMLPIGMSVLVLLRKMTESDSSTKEAGTEATIGDESAEEIAPTKSRFGTAMMLAIAYAASIGSTGSLIGTPTNALLAAYMNSAHGYTIGFGRWMLVGLPVAVLLMFAAWFILVKVLFKPEVHHLPGGKELIHSEYENLGPMSSAEKRVLSLFIAAAVSWISIPLISQQLLDLDSTMISDAGIAILAGILLFLIPAGTQRGVRLLNWQSALDLPWGVMLLFGGGLSLSSQFTDSGLSKWLGTRIEGLAGAPVWVIVVIIVIGILALTEMTSNTPVAATFLPVASGVAMGTGIAPLMLCAPVAMAANNAFMLPVSTPPNAIAYASGYVRIGQMIKGGLLINVAATILITVASTTLLVWVFGLAS